MKINKQALMLFASLLTCLQLAWSEPRSGGEFKTDGAVCPEYRWHIKFLEEMEAGNYAYQLPKHSGCKIYDYGTVIAKLGKVEEAPAPKGDESMKFRWVEMKDGFSGWTLDSWVKNYASEQE